MAAIQESQPIDEMVHPPTLGGQLGEVAGETAAAFIAAPTAVVKGLQPMTDALNKPGEKMADLQDRWNSIVDRLGLKGHKSQPNSKNTANQISGDGSGPSTPEDSNGHTEAAVPGEPKPHRPKQISGRRQAVGYLTKSIANAVLNPNSEVGVPASANGSGNNGDSGIGISLGVGAMVAHKVDPKLGKRVADVINHPGTPLPRRTMVAGVTAVVATLTANKFLGDTVFASPNSATAPGRDSPTPIPGKVDEGTTTPVPDLIHGTDYILPSDWTFDEKFGEKTGIGGPENTDFDYKETFNSYIASIDSIMKQRGVGLSIDTNVGIVGDGNPGYQVLGRLRVFKRVPGIMVEDNSLVAVDEAGLIILLPNFSYRGLEWNFSSQLGGRIGLEDTSGQIWGAIQEGKVQLVEELGGDSISAAKARKTQTPVATWTPGTIPSGADTANNGDDAANAEATFAAATRTAVPTSKRESQVQVNPTVYGTISQEGADGIIKLVGDQWTIEEINILNSRIQWIHDNDPELYKHLFEISYFKKGGKATSWFKFDCTQGAACVEPATDGKIAIAMEDPKYTMVWGNEMQSNMRTDATFWHEYGGVLYKGADQTIFLKFGGIEGATGPRIDQMRAALGWLAADRMEKKFGKNGATITIKKGETDYMGLPPDTDLSDLYDDPGIALLGLGSAPSALQ